MKFKIIPRSLTVSLALAVAWTGQAAGSPGAWAATNAPAAGQASAMADIPLRKLGEWIGLTIHWEPKQRTIIAAKGTDTIRLRLEDEGRASATANGRTIRLDGGVAVRGGTVYVTRDALRQTLGIEASWANGKPVIDSADAQTRANAFLTRLQRGDAESAYSLANAAFKAATIPAGLQEWIRQLSAYPRTWGTVAADAVHTTVTVTYQGPKMPFDVEVRLDRDGQVDDLYATMRMEGYRAPAYDRPDSYKEMPVVVGTGDHAVQATLTLPSGEGPFPAVILVQGDGELDADSTVFAQKPFRDLAAGLAGQQIAVLRMPKTTREHYVQLADHYTVEDEFVDNPLLAAEALATYPSIDPQRIYVAGHSRGGWMVPRILARDSKRLLAGAIVLAGADPRYSEIDSYDHPELGGMLPAEELAYYREQLKLVRQPDFDPANPPASFDLPPNPYWWSDIDSYEPAKEAQLRDADMLVLQGEQDFQVPAASLQGWKDIYEGRPNVEYRTYPNLTHLFTEGTLENGISNYAKPANVDPQVIEDIAKWIADRPH
ncbi:stalk domain-containing protein [Cohnella thermotolerans]|uniref:alpha/beta hydrolase family protein n=1 Tax=Cohnella thermotolerans TaxID=329858 RepID=UPI000425FA0B|nr:stalk domain-containing protein [Cohnella thermotolerans]